MDVGTLILGRPVSIYLDAQEVLTLSLLVALSGMVILQFHMLRMVRREIRQLK